MSESKIVLNTQALDKLVASFRDTASFARVGILGQSTAREAVQVQSLTGNFKSSAEPTNAEVGAAHEFGTSKLPKRSFLKMPLELKLNGALEKSKAFTDDVVKKVIASGSIKSWMQLVAKVGEAVVLDAFKTGGFGNWKAWSKGYSNKTGSLLVDTQQLRNSITSDVKE